MKAIIMITTRNLNTILRTTIYLPMASLLLTLAIAGPASAGSMVPFKGVIEGTEDFNFKDDRTGIHVPGIGGGNASHLGRFTAIWDGDITFTNEGNLHPTERTFIAANGVDKLFAKGLASGTAPVDGIQFVTETMKITGGEGRFDGASGNFDLERGVFDIAPPFTDLPTFGSFDGFITTVGSITSAHAVPEPASISLAVLGCILGLATRCRAKGK